MLILTSIFHFQNALSTWYMALSVEDTGAQHVMDMAESLHTQMSWQEPACVNDERTCSFWGKTIGIS